MSERTILCETKRSPNVQSICTLSSEKPRAGPSFRVIFSLVDKNERETHILDSEVGYK